MARMFQSLGAKVTVVLGPVSLPVPPKIKIIPVETALHMSHHVKKHLPRCDAFIAAAAVSDWRFEKQFSRKMKKGGASRMSVTLVPNPDILMEAGQWKRRTKNHKLVLVGFALETDHLARAAKKKLIQKNCDLIIGNTPDTFSGSLIKPLWVEPGKPPRSGRSVSKQRFAEELAGWLEEAL